MRLFRRSIDWQDSRFLEEAKAASRKAREQMARADEQQDVVERAIHTQRKIREDNGFAEIIEAIFNDDKE